ncbi:MAG: sulfatase [Bacteroidota bacterium]
MRLLLTFIILGGFYLSSVAQPNILIILSDDLSYHDIGCYGNKDVNTPHINQLAKEGMRFSYCFNSAPMCAPTRMSLYTGIHPVRNGAHPNHSKVYPTVQSIPHYLGELGYRVALLGKRHYKPAKNFPFEHLGGRGHDNGEGLDLDLTKVRDFFQASAAAPWCLVVASNQSHTPWNRGDTTAYAPASLKLPPYLVDTEETRRGMMKYYAEISYFDQQLGTCMQYLKESGQDEKTFVIYLSEQGSNLPHAKWTCYENGLRSAAIVRYPPLVKANSTTKAMIQYVDVLPTILELIGQQTRKTDFDGRSFLDVLSGKTKSHSDYVFGVQTSKGIHRGPVGFGIRSVRDKRYRLVYNVNHQNEFQNLVTVRGGPDGVFASWEKAAAAGDEFAAARVAAYKTRPEWELYDTKKDPYELNNLVDNPTYASHIARLKSHLLSWMEQQGDKGSETELSATERQ